MNYLIAAPFLLFIALGCFWRPAARPDVQLIEATSQRQIMGVRGGGQSIEYNFYIVVNTSEKVGFDSVWIKDKSMPVHITKNRQHTIVQNIQKGDTIVLRASEWVIYPDHMKAQQQVSSSPVSTPPIQYNGEALIGYSLAGKKKYLICEKVKPLQELARP